MRWVAKEHFARWHFITFADCDRSIFDVSLSGILIFEVKSISGEPALRTIFSKLTAKNQYAAKAIPARFGINLMVVKALGLQVSNWHVRCKKRLELAMRQRNQLTKGIT
jgi:hypothetical protein